VEFELSDDGGVEAVIECNESLEGYRGLIHGGVISSLLDAAMTNCVFARGDVALTAELNVRFRHPVMVGPPATVRARIERRYRSLYFASAELTQNHEIKATAEGKFAGSKRLTEMLGETQRSAYRR
jgi:uncharacterized protein (TIGR00369 family)